MTEKNDNTIYEGLTTRFLYDGCHNRAETICARMKNQGFENVGKLWIVPSNLQSGRITIENPLPVPWLKDATFRLPNVDYKDTLVIQGDHIQWRYHVLAATQKDDECRVYDPFTDDILAEEYLSLLGTRSLDNSACPEVDLLHRFVPYGDIPTPNLFSLDEAAELFRGMKSDSPQSPENWTSYWWNSDKGDNFSVESHCHHVNAWHLRLERLLVGQESLGGEGEKKGEKKG